MHRSIPDEPLGLCTLFDIGKAVGMAINILFSKTAESMPTASFSGIVGFCKGRITQEVFVTKPHRSQEDHKTHMPSWKSLSPAVLKAKKKKKSIVIFDLVKYF